MNGRDSKTLIRQEGIVTLVEGIRFDSWNIAIDPSLIDQIREKELIIFKNVIPKPFLLDLKKTATEFPFKYDNYKDCGNGLPGCFRRYDDLTQRDFAARKVQLFGFPFWDSDTPQVLLKFMRTWGEFTNRLRGFDVAAHFSADDEFVFFLNSYHYPPTGFLGKHHKMGIIEDLALKVPFSESVINCCNFGEDFSSGGLYVGRRGYDDTGTLTHVEPYFEWGDILYFVNDLHHEVKPVDPHKPIDMNPMKNRFIFCLVSYALKDVKKFIQ